MTEFGFTYGGRYSIDQGVSVLDVQRPLLPPVTAQTLKIPGRHGVRYMNFHYEPVEIDVDIAFDGMNLQTLQEQRREIADWLSPEEGVLPLIFDDEPHLQYGALIKDETTLEQVVRLGRGTVTFLAPDPFAYVIPDDVFTYSSDGSYDFKRSGTADSLPLIEIEGLCSGTDTIEIALNDRFLVFSGELENGETLILDSEWLTAKIEKADGSVASAMNHISSLDFPVASPGDNHLSVSPGGSAAVSWIKLTCRSRSK